MFINHNWLPFYSPEDGGGGGGETNTNVSGGGTETLGTSTEPTALDLSDETLIRVKGSDKPVKFSDHVKGFQSNFTKASQEAARLRNELKSRDERIKAFETQQRQGQQRGNADNDMLAAIKQLPYLSGNDAAEVVTAIAQQLQQRDQLTLRAFQELKALREVVGGLHNQHVGSQFESKISRWLKEGEYPEEAADLAKEIYLAYEGDDLDQDFPRIFKERWEQINRIIDSQRQKKLNAARKAPFIPGKGSVTGPSKPLEIPASASAKEVADMLWSSMGNSDPT